MIYNPNREIKKLIGRCEKMNNYPLFIINQHENTARHLSLTFPANKHRLKASHLFNDILIRADTYFLLPLQKKYYKAFREIILFKEVRMQSSKLYVGNFNYFTVDSQLEKLFYPFGKIVIKTIHRFLTKPVNRLLNF
jgi:hypothetical protein